MFCGYRSGGAAKIGEKRAKMIEVMAHMPISRQKLAALSKYSRCYADRCLHDRHVASPACHLTAGPTFLPHNVTPESSCHRHTAWLTAEWAAVIVL